MRSTGVEDVKYWYERAFENLNAMYPNKNEHSFIEYILFVPTHLVFTSHMINSNDIIIPECLRLGRVVVCVDWLNFLPTIRIRRRDETLVYMHFGKIGRAEDRTSDHWNVMSARLPLPHGCA